MARHLYRNTLSYVGFLIMAIGFVLVVASLGMRLSVGGSSPYLGILTFMVFPGIINVGLVVVLVGMWRESKRRRRVGREEEPPYPRIDLNDPRQRRLVLWAVPAVALGGLLLAYVAYNGFLFTESDTFCGKVCHEVMQPEYTAYLHSPHANVKCVECHVGPGADWYVRSKLSGAGQVFAVLFNTYEKPIETPIKNLRPARDTCEECHWPEKFFGAQLVENPHFRYDEDNTAEQITFAVKTGGGGPGAGFGRGIHWHMIVSVEVEYAVEDHQRQEIPWFRVTRPDGSTAEYTARDTDLTPEEIAELPTHIMDCMDCHNRPTHIYGAVDTKVDRALADHRLPRDLPWMKKVAVEALLGEYASHDEAAQEIPAALRSFYQDGYPDVAEARSSDIGRAADEVVAIYQRSVFPAMKVTWGTYTNNIGHRNWPGCFRCHDGQHATQDGKVLPQTCTDCHTDPRRSPLSQLGDTLPTGDPDWHRVPLEGGHADLLCHRCHSADQGEPPECAECHGIDTAQPMMASMDCVDCHERPGFVQPVTDCALCHEDMGGLHEVPPHQGSDCWTCHQPHGWNAATRDTCLQCHDDRTDHMADAGACSGCHEFTT